MRKREPIPIEVREAPCDVEAGQRALAILARWATRRAQRIAKERSQAASRNGPRNRQLRPQDGEERT